MQKMLYRFGCWGTMRTYHGLGIPITKMRYKAIFGLKMMVMGVKNSWGPAGTLEGGYRPHKLISNAGLSHICELRVWKNIETLFYLFKVQVCFRLFSELHFMIFLIFFNTA